MVIVMVSLTLFTVSSSAIHKTILTCSLFTCSSRLSSFLLTSSICSCESTRGAIIAFCSSPFVSSSCLSSCDSILCSSTRERKQDNSQLCWNYEKEKHSLWTKLPTGFKCNTRLIPCDWLPSFSCFPGSALLSTSGWAFLDRQVLPTNSVFKDITAGPLM